MNELELIISLFPLVFMIHEFEEIICLKRWVSKNGLWLTSKYPKLTKQVTHLGQLSVSAFTVAVLEEFVLVSIITVYGLLRSQHLHFMFFSISFNRGLLENTYLQLLHRFYLYLILFGD